jgi:cytochrome c peroxidase
MKIPSQNPLAIVVIISTLFIAGCGGSSGGSSDDAAGTAAGSSIVALGKKIFFDEDLSSNNNQSCGSCHDPVAGFADPDATVAAPVSAGSPPATFGNRNAPTAAYASSIPIFVKVPSTTLDGTDSNFQGGQFLDGRSSTLIDQAKAPFLNPAEMNNVDEADVVDKVQNASYADDFMKVFGVDAFDNTLQAYDNIAVAIAAFETSREMNPFTSKFDAVMAAGSTINFTPSELRGFELFKDPVKAKCANCHTVDDPAVGSLFTDFNYYNIGTPKNPANPVYAVEPLFRDDGLGGRIDLTVAEKAAEQGKFRTPSLRNVELTAPYMHNGVYATLTEVIRHYDIQIANGFVTPEVNANIANELDEGGPGLGLQPDDYTDLENFMLTLTDGFM